MKDPMKILGVLLLALTIPAAAAAPDKSKRSSMDQPQRMEERVRHELVTLPFFSVFDNLGYSVVGNTVTVYGQVTRPTLKRDAEKVVQRIEGVERVNNEIEVLPLSPFDDRIRRAEYRALFSNPSLQRYAMGANPSIRIIVKNGHVMLEGFVSNEMDKNIAGIQANGVPGVFSVTNNLKVS